MVDERQGCAQVRGGARVEGADLLVGHFVATRGDALSNSGRT
ncbi:MAG: hypothetical protein AB1578_09860 [Thermodesulfobacteriota bacterium]